VNGLEQVGEELWVHETPLRFLGMPIGRRMAVIRLSGGELFGHSPAALTDAVRGALDRLGPVRFVVPASNCTGTCSWSSTAPRIPRRCCSCTGRVAACW
jgi:hypothetical protein